jgi:DNA-binding NarL/FixJ family response regulator
MATPLVIVDDHPAVRAGLETMLDWEHDLEVAATAATADEGFTAIAELQPPVAVVDYQLPDGDGFTLCLRTCALPKPPRIIVYTAFATARHAVLAAVAGAHGLVSKCARPDELLDAIRADSPRHGDRITPYALREAAAQLDPDDLTVLGMLVHDVLPAEIAVALAIDDRRLLTRRWAMLERLVGKPRRRSSEPRRGRTARPATVRCPRPLPYSD